MQDPTYGVPAQLLPHVHLVSGQKYPLQQQLNLDQAYHYLFEAPKIVKQVAPMSWQYISGPQRGTVFLTWIGNRTQNQFAFPSDGFVWADPEQRFTQDFGGYTLEIAVHNSGYQPGVDQISCHARRRYRFISKNPAVNSLPPDPSLWIVHYSQAEPQNCIPASQVAITPQLRQQLSERHWIESQGRLERQDFMLHDRDKWPQLNMPGRTSAPGGQSYAPNAYNQNPMAHIGNPRFSGQYYHQAQQPNVGPSPAKRQRHHAPSQMPASAAALMNQDTSIEDEENILLGDLLDHLTQRDISLTRYKQHHEWMEEIFSSPYATSQIIPADLGFGLMGELAGLTDGILALPLQDAERPATKNGDTKHAFNKVSPEQLKEFENRVSAQMEKGQAEIQRMKDEHAKRMGSLNRSKGLMQAERRLRNAAWDVNDTGNEFWRLDELTATNGGPDRKGPKESADNIVKEIEGLVGGTIKPEKEANVVEKGGLRREEKQRPPPPSNIVAANDASTGMQLDHTFNQPTQAQHQYGQHIPASQQGALPTALQSTQQTQQAPAQPQTQTTQAPQPQPTASHQATASAPDASMDDLETMNDTNLSLIDDVDMDMDMDASVLNFSAGTTPKTGAADPSTHYLHQPQQQQTQSIPLSSTQPNVSATMQSTNVPTQPVQHTDMFGNTADAGFGDFDTGDGLIDFDGGAGGDDLGFDMDNSAFGDAFHNTEAHDGDEGGDI